MDEHMTLRQRVLALFKSNETEITPGDAQRLLGLSKRETVSNLLAEMARSGSLVRVAQGRYRAREHARHGHLGVDAHEKLAHCRRLLESYDAVIDDVSEWDESEWQFVRVRLAWMRADIAEEVAKLSAEVANAHK